MAFFQRPTDEALVKKYLMGDQYAAEELVSRHTETVQKRCGSFVWQYKGNHSDVEDLTQESFIKVFKYLHDFDPTQGPFMAWFSRIIHNVCIDWIRQKAKRGVEKTYNPTDVRDDDSSDLVTIADPNISKADDQLVNQEIQHEIEACLKHLSEKHKEIFILREQEDLSYQEISERLNIELGTVMSRLFHMRKNMTVCLMRAFDDKQMVDLSEKYRALYLEMQQKEKNKDK